jgi:hypothetical protein
MGPTEVQAKAVIAGALIASHAVEIPHIPKGGDQEMKDPGAIRLRELTDYVYRIISSDGARL